MDLARVFRFCQIRLGSKKGDSEMEICVREVLSEETSVKEGRWEDLEEERLNSKCRCS